MLACGRVGVQYYHQWVGITDPLNEKDKGIQGYLKLSVSVLGPGDKMYIHDPALEVGVRDAAAVPSTLTPDNNVGGGGAWAIHLASPAPCTGPVPCLPHL
jgi:hypothetical protein